MLYKITVDTIMTFLHGQRQTVEIESVNDNCVAAFEHELLEEFQLSPDDYTVSFYREKLVFL